MELLGDAGDMESNFFAFGDRVSVEQDGAYFAPRVPTAQKLFWMHPMALLGDVPFGDSANHDASYVHGSCQTYHRLKNHFVLTRRNY
jgi:hypothetical protein